MTTESLENVGLDGYVGEELPLSMYELIACFHEFFNYKYILHKYVHIRKKTTLVKGHGGFPFQLF